MASKSKLVVDLTSKDMTDDVGMQSDTMSQDVGTFNMLNIKPYNYVTVCRKTIICQSCYHNTLHK